VREVLFEKATRGKAMHGFTDNYIRVELPASQASDAYDNEIVKVKITNINHDKSSTTAVIV
jgi:threonylcarbamoyladenosine tRNA methylthiotransferase MtaB